MTIKLLKDIVYISDGNYSSKYPRNDEFVTKGIPFIRANNLVDNTVVDYDMLFISQEKHKELKKGHLKTNDVLLTTRGNIGRVSIVPDKYNDANINAQIVLLRCDKNIILPSYLLYCLQSDFCQRQMEKLETGTALKQLPVGRLSDLRINVVPIKEQEKIVKRLCVADSIIRNHKTLLDNLALLVKSRFIEMFGSCNKEESLINVCNFIDYRGKTPEKSEDGIPLITAKNVRDNAFSLDPQEFIPKENYDSVMTRGIPKVNDVLFTTEAPLGNVCRIPAVYEKFCVGQRIITMQPNKDILTSEYLERALLTEKFQEKIWANSSGSTVKGIRSKLLEKLTIPIPPLEEQRRFADFVAQVDKSKLAVQQSLDELETLKKSLMQQYFG